MTEVRRLLTLRARTRPADAAFLSADRTLTWRALARDALGLGLAPGRRVGLALADPLAFAPAYLGALAAGATAVPIDPRVTLSELAETVDRLGVDLLLSDRPGEPPVRRSGTGSDPEVRPAVLLSSSGTTGRPKAIGLSTWQLLHAARRVARHHRFGPASRGYSPLPLFHINAQVMGLLATLVSGGSLVLDRRFERDAYWDRVARFAPTWLNTVPAILATLASAAPPASRVVAGIRFARSASAPLPATTRAAFTATTGVPILQTYGMTEAAGQITADSLDPDLSRPDSVGRPVGVGLAVLGPDGRPLRPGESGMVALRGRTVVHSYLEDGATRCRPARNEGGWLLTGDLGTRDEDGYVYLAGRADDVINRGGEKVFPQEVEDVLRAHPAVRAVAVVGAPHERLGQVPVAVLTVAPGHDPASLSAALTGLCEGRLARYKRPVRFEVAAALPTGPTGKVLRRRVREQLAR